MKGNLSIPREVSGKPRFPPPYVGSISHTKRCALAWVAQEPFALGLDIEERGRTLSREALELITSKKERESLSSNPSEDLLLFSMKESLFKLSFSGFAKWLEPEDIEVLLFRGTITASLPTCHLGKLWITANVTHRLVFTAAALLPADYRFEKLSRFSLFSK